MTVFPRAYHAVARCIAALLLAALLAPMALAAQERTAATIAGILDLTDRGSRRLLPGPTRRALVRRSDSDGWLDGHQDLELFLDDQLLVEPRTVVRLGLRTANARGQVSLSPDLQAPDGALLVNEIGGHERALYRIEEAPRELGDLQLVVARGSLALDWARGRLVLWAGGIRSVVTGTRIVVAVDSVTQRGFIHLIEGHVTFPDRPEIDLRAGEWVLFQGTTIVTVGVPAAVAPARLAEAARWTADRAWPKPFYLRPWPYVALGAVVGAVYLMGNEGYSCDDCQCSEC
jgi:hypothetical protein